jgi:hypothetical protein
MVINKKVQHRQELMKDILLVIGGGILAYYLTNAGAIESIINLLGGNIVTIFVAGLFFTSVFTIAPASVALASMATTVPIHTVAFWGALGALCGDLLLFYFIKDKFTNDLLGSLRPSLIKHFFKSLHLGFMKWLSPVLGAFIIASPLPDELGLTLMGLSKMKTSILVPISFVMNGLGIYFIIWFAEKI